MNKAQLVNTIAEKSSLKKADIEKTLNAFIEATSEALRGGDKVQMVGFGTFEVSERAARTGRNPSTGETIEIPASKNVRFKAGKALRDSLQ